MAPRDNLPPEPDGFDDSDQLHPVEGAISLRVQELVELQQHIHRLEAQRIELLADCERLAGKLAQEVLPDKVADPQEIAHRQVEAELGAALRVTDRTVGRWMHQAHLLVTDFRPTLAALCEGEISPQHANAITTAGEPLDVQHHRQLYEEIVLRRAKTTSVNRLRPFAHKVAERYRQQSIDERHRTASQERYVSVRPYEDGMALLQALLPAVQAYGIFNRLQQFAQQESSGDGRSIDQLRTDIFADLLLCADPIGHVASLEPEDQPRAPIQAQVQVKIPVRQMLARASSADALGGQTDLDDPVDPAVLVGYGPIDSQTARHLAGCAPGWDRIFHLPDETILTVDRYRPSEAIKRFLQARDEHCRFPGCRQPTSRCDIDHTIPASAGGATSTQNLAHLCRRHHRLKHLTAWKVQQQSHGVLVWTSPTGRQYVDSPPSYEPEESQQVPPVDPWGSATDQQPFIKDPPF